MVETVKHQDAPNSSARVYAVPNAVLDLRHLRHFDCDGWGWGVSMTRAKTYAGHSRAPNMPCARHAWQCTLLAVSWLVVSRNAEATPQVNEPILIALGGDTLGSGYLNTSEYYSFVTGTWASFQGMDVLGAPRARFPCVTVEGPLGPGRKEIFYTAVIGGSHQSVAETGLFEYAYSSDALVHQQKEGRWYEFPDLAANRVLASIAVAAKVLYLIGGGEKQPGRLEPVLMDTVWALDLSTGSAPWQWQSVQSLPEARSRAGAVSVGSSVLLMGGRTLSDIDNSVQHLNTVLKYTAASDAWSSLQPMPQTREDFACLAIDGATDTRVFVIGGDSTSDKALKTTYVYSTSQNTWTQAAAMSTGRSAFSAVHYNNYIYAFGGHSFDGRSVGQLPTILASMERYSVVEDKWLALASSHDLITHRRYFGAGFMKYSPQSGLTTTPTVTRTSTGTSLGLLAPAMHCCEV